MVFTVSNEQAKASKKNQGRHQDRRILPVLVSLAPVSDAAQTYIGVLGVLKHVAALVRFDRIT